MGGGGHVCIEYVNNSVHLKACSCMSTEHTVHVAKERGIITMWKELLLIALFQCIGKLF